MQGPHHDDTPDLAQAVAFDLDDILEEYRPVSPDHFERLAHEAERSAKTYIGGPEIALAVAAELRRRAAAMRNAAG